MADMCHPHDLVWQEQWKQEELMEEKPTGVKTGGGTASDTKKGRQEEIETFHKIGVYTYASRREVDETPGAKLIDTTWAMAPAKWSLDFALESSQRARNGATCSLRLPRYWQFVG